MIIALCGSPGAGKSFLATQLSKSLNWPNVGFGKFLKQEALKKNIIIDRDSLQKLGQDLVNEDANLFCRNVMKSYDLDNKDDFILDGLRHQVVLDFFENLMGGRPVTVVYVAVNLSVLKRRLALRGEEELISTLDTESTEREVSAYLKNRADLILNGEAEVTGSIASIQKLLR